MKSIQNRIYRSKRTRYPHIDTSFKWRSIYKEIPPNVSVLILVKYPLFRVPVITDAAFIHRQIKRAMVKQRKKETKIYFITDWSFIPDVTKNNY